MFESRSLSRFCREGYGLDGEKVSWIGAIIWHHRLKGQNSDT